jgi:hypothetical protein
MSSHSPLGSEWAFYVVCRERRIELKNLVGLQKL